MLTTPPLVANEVAPEESNVLTLVLPVTSSVVSRVTASSTFSVPFTVVITPVEAMLTTPLLVANEVAPEEFNVLILVSPVTSRVPLIVALPILEILLLPILILPVMEPPAKSSFSVSNSASASFTLVADILAVADDVIVAAI